MAEAELSLMEAFSYSLESSATSSEPVIAPIQQRFLARFLDLIFLYAHFIFGYGVSLYVFGYGAPKEQFLALAGLAPGVGITGGLLWMIFGGVLNFGILTFFLDASFGKWLCGLKIKRIDGEPPQFFDHVFRFIAVMLSCAFFGAGFLLPLVDTHFKAWHDDYSKTDVFETHE